MGGLRSYLLTGVGPWRGRLAAIGLRGVGWRLAEDPFDADLLVVAGSPGARLGAAIAELRVQLPWHVETLWVTASGAPIEPTLAMTLARYAPLRIAQSDRDADIATLVTAARPFEARIGAKEIIDAALPRLVELDGASDLASEDLVLSLGPIHPALATPIRLILALDGEQVRDVVRDPGYAVHVPIPGDPVIACLDPEAPAAARVTAALLHTGVPDVNVAIAACERERASHFLHACARQLWLLGMVPGARELQMAADSARRGDTPASAIPILLRSPRLRTAMRLRMRGIGPVARGDAARAGLRGPVGRASGLSDDARTDGTFAAAYERLGGSPLTDAPTVGDAAARFERRLLEAARALALADAADHAGGSPVAIAQQDRVDIELPRGRLIVSREQGRPMHVDPASAGLLDFLPAMLVGARYADAIAIIDGIDASAEEAERALYPSSVAQVA